MQIAAQLPGVKGVLLEFAARVGSLVPERQAKRPISHLVKALFMLMRDAANLSPELHTKDGRFFRLMGASERVLIFVSEEDPHYAGQIAQAMLLTHDIVDRSRRKFPPGAKGDIAWMQWASEHGITRVKASGG
jgi:hypothetical protein